MVMLKWWYLPCIYTMYIYRQKNLRVGGLGLWAGRCVGRCMEEWVSEPWDTCLIIIGGMFLIPSCGHCGLQFTYASVFY